MVVLQHDDENLLGRHRWRGEGGHTTKRQTPCKELCGEQATGEGSHVGVICSATPSAPHRHQQEHSETMARRPDPEDATHWLSLRAQDIDFARSRSTVTAPASPQWVGHSADFIEPLNLAPSVSERQLSSLQRGALFAQFALPLSNFHVLAYMPQTEFLHSKRGRGVEDAAVDEPLVCATCVEALIPRC